MNNPSPRPMRWMTALAAAIVAAVLSTRTVETGPQPFAHADKLVHFIGYAGLALLVLRAMKEPGKLTVSAGQVVLAAALTAAYGGALEIVQGYLPTHTASWADAGANCLGALAGAYAYSIVIAKVDYLS